MKKECKFLATLITSRSVRSWTWMRRWD